MSDKTKIEWTDATWNPIRGCSKVSPGCTHCYAMHVAARFNGPGLPYEGLATAAPANWTGVIRIDESKLQVPLRWKRSRRIFVNSMSDLFHENCQDLWIARVFAAMYEAQWHTFQVLTKRAERMREILNRPTFRDDVATQAWHLFNARAPQKAALVTDADIAADLAHLWPLPNVQLGVSVEDQPRADERIELLLQTPAAVRFLSCEPLLGPVHIPRTLATCPHCGNKPSATGLRSNRAERFEYYCGSDACFDQYPLPSIDWVSVGGESGKKARPMHPEWVRGIRDQCAERGVPFFFKQWGEWAPSNQIDPRLPGQPLARYKLHRFPGAEVRRFGKQIAGRRLDGVEWSQFPDRVPTNNEGATHGA